MSALRHPVVIDSSVAFLNASGNASRSAARAPQRSEQFSADQVTKPNVIAEVLTRIMADITRLFAFLLASPRSRAVIFRGQICGSLGASSKLTLVHNLNGPVFFGIVGWRGNGVASAPILVSDEADTASVLTDANTLVLRSYIAGTADIEVFRVPGP